MGSGRVFGEPLTVIREEASAELSCGGQGDAFISRDSHLDGRFPGADLAPVAFGVVETFAGPALVANKNRRVGLPHRAHVLYSAGFGWLASDKREAFEEVTSDQPSHKAMAWPAGGPFDSRSGQAWVTRGRSALAGPFEQFAQTARSLVSVDFACGDVEHELFPIGSRKFCRRQKVVFF